MVDEIWAVDCETDPFKYGRVPEPFIWGAFNGSEYHEFDTGDAVIDFLQDRKCIAYAHNGGKFDWHFILHRLEPFSEVRVIQSRLAAFTIGQCEFRDSYSILPIRLAEFQKQDIAYDKMERDVRAANMAEIKDYLRSDCVNLWHLVNQFIEDYGVNLTLAGAALKQYRKICDVQTPATNRQFYETLSPFYHGGRVQAFKTGVFETPFTVADINSAYPYAMTHYHPTGSTIHVSDRLPKSDRAIQRAFIHLRGPARGAFPVRAPTGGLSFPEHGRVTDFFVTGWEYCAARDIDLLDDARVIAVYTLPEAITFTDYVDHFYALKSAAKAADDKARYQFAKLFLNSLYGKFGANPEKYNEWLVIPPELVDQAEEIDGYTFAGELHPHVLVKRPLSEAQQRYYNVATAASITGFVRAMLLKAIHSANNVMYCDTDSIVAEHISGLDLDPARLGAWDIEAKCVRGGIAGKKLYAFETFDGEWKTASKGVNLDAAQIMRVARGEHVTDYRDAPSFSLQTGVKFTHRTVKRAV